MNESKVEFRSALNLKISDTDVMGIRRHRTGQCASTHMRASGVPRRSVNEEFARKHCLCGEDVPLGLIERMGKVQAQALMIRYMDPSLGR